MIASVVILFLIIGLFIAYMFDLQKQFLAACREDKQLSTFFNTPAGLPSGTIRSIITLIILTIALYLIVLSMAVPEAAFPEVIAAILTTVIGFYFGSRSSSGGSGAPTEEIERARQQQHEGEAAKDDNEATTWLRKVQKGVALTKTVVDILPADVKEKYGGALDKLERGADVAKVLFDNGDKTGAAAQAAEVFELFKRENPLRGVVSQALSSEGAIECRERLGGLLKYYHRQAA